MSVPIRVVDLAEEPPRRVFPPGRADPGNDPGGAVPGLVRLRLLHAAYHLKVISDGADFAEDVLSAGLRIMFDPVQVEGRARWTEIAREGELPPVDAETGAAPGNGARA